MKLGTIVTVPIAGQRLRAKIIRQGYGTYTVVLLEAYKAYKIGETVCVNAGECKRTS